ncbi:condensation domain-containing protein [Streptomyces sp. NPDC059373]
MRRRLSPTERFVWAAGEVLPVTIALTGRIHGRTTPNLLRAALSAVRRRHPLLAARIADAGPWQARLTTDGVPDPDLRVVRVTAPDHFGRTAEIVEEELQRPFDAGTGPLARFVMVDAGDSFDLVGVYHHLVADGLSMCVVLRDLLRLLADPAADMSPVLAAPADDLLPGRRVDPADLRRMARDLRGKSRPPHPGGGPLRHAIWSLDAAATSALLARCRAEGATLQAALSTAFARALADLGHPAAPAAIAVPADLRRLLDPSPGEAVGLYAATLLTEVDGNSPDDFWEVARSVRADLHHRLRPEELVPLVRVLRLLPFLPRAAVSSLLLRSERRQSLFDVSISNMRPSSVPADYGPLRLDALYPAAHTSLSGTPLVFVVGHDARLFFTVTSTDDGRSAKLCDRAMSHLTNAERPLSVR